MYMIDLINKKKQGNELSTDEIIFLVKGINEQTIPDYQITAWAMAVYFQGMSNRELAEFTKAIIESGDVISHEAINGFTVDKHSTGGVGDKISLIFAPIAASLGLKVTKMSGRSLGITGGTIDKLETIPHFQSELAVDKFIKIVNEVGMSIISQTANLVPADKKLYALRDVSGTIDSLPLIAASVMSKKIAMGADLILLDVKCGTGAFAQDIVSARKLANLMIEIGKSFNKTVYAVISNMNQPLGTKIGNSLEIAEVLDCLKNKGASDLKELTATLVAMALVAAKKVPSLIEGQKQALKAFESEIPLKIFKSFVVAQSGDTAFFNQINQTNKTKYKILIKSSKNGFLDFTNNYLLGELSTLLGAGRLEKNDLIDSNAGIVLKAIHGDKINKNDIIMELYTNKSAVFHPQFQSLANQCFQIRAQAPTIIPLILEIIM